jgi:mono/diheme cytochrome c family protein
MTNEPNNASSQPEGVTPTPASPSPANRELATDQEPRNAPDILPLHRQAIREMEDPHDGVAPTPVWLMLVYFGLLMWGGYYLAANSGGFQVDVYNEDPAARFAGSGEAGAERRVDLTVVGKRVYNNCVQCHQADGEGVSGTFPPLNGSERVQGAPHVLAALLLHGLQGPVVVRGNTYRGEMPGWSQLSDIDIAGVLTHIRKSWDNNAGEVSPDLVAAMRRQTAGRSRAYTDEELDALEAEGPPGIESNGEALASPPTEE